MVTRSFPCPVLCLELHLLAVSSQLDIGIVAHPYLSQLDAYLCLALQQPIMTSTTSPAAVLDAMRDIERASYSVDEKHSDAKQTADGAVVPPLYATGTPSSDPNLIYDAAREKALVRKVDMYIVPTVAILYLLCFIDRSVYIVQISAGLNQTANCHLLFCQQQSQRRQRSYRRPRKRSRHEPALVRFQHPNHRLLRRLCRV